MTSAVSLPADAIKLLQVFYHVSNILKLLGISQSILNLFPRSSVAIFLCISMNLYHKTIVKLLSNILQILDEISFSKDACGLFQGMIRDMNSIYCYLPTLLICIICICTSFIQAIFCNFVVLVQLILILWKLIVWKKSLVWKIFQLTKQSST